MTNSYLDELTILKEQLSAEGIFNKAKRKLPLNPQKIAIIIRTGSPLIKDFYDTVDIKNREIYVVELSISDTGISAAKEVIENIKRASELNCSVIVIAHEIRNEEDVKLFSDENLVRAVANSKVPVISAVGHEIDWPLCDYASDVRVGNISGIARLIIK